MRGFVVGEREWAQLQIQGKVEFMAKEQVCVCGGGGSVDEKWLRGYLWGAGGSLANCTSQESC